MSAVRLEGVGKRFPVRRSWRETMLHPTRTEYQTALEDVGLTIGEGEFFGLLGPNGAGKSTLFKILATLVLPDRGTATVHGLHVAREPERVRRLLVPVIPSERSLYWRISAEENLNLFAALYGIHGREARARVAEVLEVLDLADTGRKQVGLFSTGMRQRLLIARALLARPRILLLDEPTRSLDPVSARDLRVFLKEEIGERRNCTVLLATHDHEEVRDLCDRVGVLHEGRLLACGATHQVTAAIDRPRYRIRTREPDHPALQALRRNGGRGARGPSASGPGATVTCGRDGWFGIEVELEEGDEAAAALLGSLAHAGVPIARFERVEPTLADLIDRIVAGEGS